MVVDTRPPKLRIKILQSETAFDADNLDGESCMVAENNSLWVWFDVQSYDGTIYFEVSPNGGDVWFPVQGFKLDEVATLMSSVASPVNEESYVIRVPSHSLVRVKMAGGTDGALTVYARNVEWPY